MIYDRTLTVSLGGSRKALSWAETSIRWSALAERLRTPVRGTESHAAYLRMPKARQDALKDIGGFVGGTLRNGRRRAGNVTGRDLVTLDLDAIPAGGTTATLERVSALGCAACVYSTRKHDPEHPRLRVVLPLERTVTAEEYEPIARRLGEWLGIACCDPTTFQSYRLMYWPSASADSEYIFEVFDEPFLKAGEVLGTYRDWKDVAGWPQAPGQAAERRRAARQEDPTAKGGLIGAFCRTYGIRRAMDELIPGAYEPTDDPDRYTFTGGSTSGGAIVYEDKWLYSHHATDPAGGKLANAWDLVRLHLYGARDEDARPDTPVNRLPSSQAMAERAQALPEVRLALLDEGRERLAQDFGAPDPDGDWRTALEMNRNGRVAGSLSNLRIILDNDPFLAPVSLDTFQQRCLVRGPLPWDEGGELRDWADADDTGAAWYLEKAYGITDLRRVKMAVDGYLAAHRTDALQEYLDGLTWDGTPRVDTLLVKYLLADDTPYTRAVTRKTLVAAVARAREPGRKFDTVLTLVGAQGIAKSLLAATLGGEWYNDNIQAFTGKEASEQLRGVWIVEIPEVDRFSAKYEAAAVKQFITRQDDIYREAYGRRTGSHPRRCVFIATTNAPNFLTDAGGNRRWWIVPCRATARRRGADIAQLRRDRDQVWAEAEEYYRAGEPLTLGAELQADAAGAQEQAMEDDPWRGMIAEFVARRVPADWEMRPPEARILWWNDEFGQRGTALVERRRVCVAEIWCELFGRDRASLDGRASRRIAGLLRRLPGWRDAGPRPTAYGSQKCFVYEPSAEPENLTIQNYQPEPKTTKTTETTKTTKK